ncbi:MAG: hypothetical protein R2834_04395 [Rhodothermales bacterium]
MFFIYDNLAATMVALAVLLVLVSMQQRMRDVSIEQVGVYAAKKQSLEFGLWMRDDIANIGNGVGSGVPPVTGYVPHATLPGMTSSFSFLAIPPDDSTGTVATISYQLTPVYESDGVTPRTIGVDSLTVPLFEVQRFVDGVLDGKSAPYVTYFNIDLLDVNGVSVAGAPQLTEQIRMSFSMGVPLTQRSYVRETHWGATILVN